MYRVRAPAGLLAGTMKKAPKEKEKPVHKISFDSLISWGCLCGARWMNERLKGKTDEALEAEREAAFEAHAREMERGGF